MHRHHVQSHATSISDGTTAVAVASDRSLVADTVAAALTGSNLVIVPMIWPRGDRSLPAGWPRDAVPSLGLLLCDLQPSATRTARYLVRAYPTRWLLLTDRPKGPQWGAMLDAGVVGILQSSTTLSDLLLAIEAARFGDPGLVPSDRDELVQAWLQDEAEREDAVARLKALTTRETGVLRELHHGRSVHEIAASHGVAHSTVRTQVRSVLRKLRVSSQLAAVAMFDKWECS